MSTRLADYDYLLPEELIAKYPPTHRGDSRLLVIHRISQTWADRRFSDLPEYLQPGDVLVLNRTKVIPARLIGRRTTGGKIEVLLHQRLEGDAERWNVLTYPARKAPPGEMLVFDGLMAEVESDLGNGQKILRFSEGGAEFMQAVDRIGQVPLPPYLDREPEEADRERYQTVYASVPGAVAAPTAGLHFTEELLNRLQSKGIKIAYLTLHTGLGTFRPVESEDITKHRMHEEYFELDEANARIINEAKASGHKCIAIGTTSVRALETLAKPDHTVSAANGMSGIFIYPPYKFKVVDAMITNFHLPKSTLLMMISAFSGREFILRCYEHAIEERYRFFSYGDAMLIL